MMVDACQKRAQQSPQKRRLVSLFEANEVAKRLATKEKSRQDDGYGHRYDRYGRRRGRQEEEENEKLDEVALWGGWAAQWKETL